MTKLFNAYFNRLSKWTIFRIMLLVTFICGIPAALVMYFTKVPEFDLPYAVSYLVFPQYIGILIGLFNYPLFTNGTIRNQISVGHKRSSIYFADWAASNAFSVSLYILFLVSSFTVNAILSDNLKDSISVSAVLSSALLCTVQIIFYSTLTQLFCITLKGVKSFLAIYIGNQVIDIIGLIISAMAFNNKVSEKILVFFPTSACMNFCSNEKISKYFLPSLLIMAAETLIIYICGSRYFRKTDLN